MSGKQTLIVMGLHGGIALAVIIAGTVLALKGAIDAQTVSVLFGAALGAAGASASSIAALGAAVNGKMTITPEASAQREETLRQAIASPNAPQPSPDDASTLGAVVEGGADGPQH